nr:hypothetical protein [Streptomyces sp. NK15101]
MTGTCQDCGEKLAGNRPLSECPCSLSGRFLDHGRDAVQRSAEPEFEETLQTELEAPVMGDGIEQGIRTTRLHRVEPWLILFHPLAVRQARVEPRREPMVLAGGAVPVLLR